MDDGSQKDDQDAEERQCDKKSFVSMRLGSGQTRIQAGKLRSNGRDSKDVMVLK